MSRQIDVHDQAVLVLLDLKTKQLDKALEEHSKALDDLIKSITAYSDWLQEQIVRLDGER